MRGRADIPSTPEIISGQTFHARRGDLKNAFRYGVDYILVDAEAQVEETALFARNRRAPVSLHDTDHGGTPGSGRGAAWVREVLAGELPAADIARIELLAQPRVFGHVFNPVAFWLILDTSDDLVAVIAEVTNTYGDRHSYLCRTEDGTPIGPEDHLAATKIFHVSPFQPIAGAYDFTFDITPDKIAIRIGLTHDGGGVVATLTGDRRPMATAALLRAMVRRPFGSRRALALIHWQALKLWWRGARFVNRPEPPNHELSK